MRTAMMVGVLALLLGNQAVALRPARAGEDGDVERIGSVVRRLKNRDVERRRDALEIILLRARKLDPADADRAVEALGRLLDGEEDEDARSLALSALGRIGGSRAAAPLLLALERETEPGPQGAAVDAVGDLPSDAVAASLSTLAFRGSTVRARCLAVEAAGRVPGSATLKMLLAVAETTHPWAVEASALKALALRGDPRAVDHVMASLDHADPAIVAAAREAAADLLGVDHGDDTDAWRTHWKRHRDRWQGRPAKPSSPPNVTVTRGAPSVDTRTVARFYDIPVTGNRVAFVMDCSQSMWGPAMETAKKELAAAIKGLRSGQRFGVVFFNEKVWTWRETLVPATAVMKWELVSRLADLPTRSYTNIHDSLEQAFGWAGRGRRAVADPPGLDEVFFLSDGEPNRGRTRDPDQICEQVKSWNATARARVHTVALGDRAVDLLERLAKENGGTCTRR